MIAVAVCFVTIAVAFDLKTDRIPNALNLTGLTAGLLGAYEQTGPTGLFTAVKAVMIMFLAAFVLYVLGALRGGDGKMLCALCAIFGGNGVHGILLWSLLAAAVLGIPSLLKRKQGQRTKIHCSVPIALGTALNLLFHGGV